jgi:hypothetical protein
MKFFLFRTRALGGGEENAKSLHPDVARPPVGSFGQKRFEQKRFEQKRFEQIVGRTISKSEQQRRSLHSQRLRSQEKKKFKFGSYRSKMICPLKNATSLIEYDLLDKKCKSFIKGQLIDKKFNGIGC